MTAASRKWLVAFALARAGRLDRGDVRPLQSDQESRLLELLRHQRDRLVQGGVSEPVRVDRRRPGRGRRRAVLRAGSCCCCGAAAARARIEDSATRVHLRGVDAGARGRAVSGLRVVLHAQGSLPAVRRDLRRGDRRLRHLRRSQFRAHVLAAVAAPCATSACWWRRRWRCSSRCVRRRRGVGRRSVPARERRPAGARRCQPLA